MQVKIESPDKVKYILAAPSKIKLGSSFIWASIFFTIFLLSTLVIPPKSNSFNYFGAIKDKHHRLNTLASPKMVFVGGSNLAFGLDSAAIEKEFHMPVVNMGLCAPWGLNYLLEEIKDDIHKGDIVVIIPEYAILQNLVYGSPDLIHLIEVYPRSIIYLLKTCTSPESFFNSLKFIFEVPAAKWSAFSSILQSAWNSGHLDLSILDQWELADPPGPHVRYYFDRHGDYFGHFTKPNEPYHPLWEIIKEISPQATNILNKFHSFTKQVGAQVVLIPAPLPKDYLTPKMCSEQVIKNWPIRKIEIPILSAPRKYSFDKSYFYGVPYHLNFAGRSIRTSLIIEDLRKYFKNTNQKLSK